MPLPSHKRTRTRKRTHDHDKDDNEGDKMWNSSSSRSKKRGGSSGSNSHNKNINNRYSATTTTDEEAIIALFEDIADEDDPSVAGMEGISTLCDKLDIDPLEDIRVLVLLWKLGSKERPAQISKEEWISGCQTLQVDSIDKFKALLPSLDVGFLDQTEFRDFYKVSDFFSGFASGWKLFVLFY